MIRTKVLVVGGGPGGYVAAIRAGHLGAGHRPRRAAAQIKCGGVLLGVEVDRNRIENPGDFTPRERVADDRPRHELVGGRVQLGLRAEAERVGARGMNLAGGMRPRRKGERCRK